MLAQLPNRLRALSPRVILAIGWIGIVLYGFPGHMSYDSVAQLAESRSGVYSNAHPPAMAALWRLCEVFIAGPFLMLALQTLGFITGAYLLLCRRIASRPAAVLTVLVLWFPPVANTMSTIWKDSQMAAFLLLGTALILSPRRKIKLVGLLALCAATAMRHNALAMTLPLVVLLFVWDPAHRWWKRYALAACAWIAVTLAAQLATKALTDHERFLWHESIALLDMVGTLRHVDDLPDETLRELFAGLELRHTENLHEKLRYTQDPNWSLIDNLWWATDGFFIRPRNAEERAAAARAWRAVIPAHLGAYLTYRTQVFRQLIQLTEGPFTSAAYIWFTDIQDLLASADLVSHTAYPSRGQQLLNAAMWRLGFTALFRIYIYLFLALILLAFCLRNREPRALLASGLVGEAALFVLAPTPDFRYSFWLVVTAVLSLILVIAPRMKRATQASVDE